MLTLYSQCLVITWNNWPFYANFLCQLRQKCRRTKLLCRRHLGVQNVHLCWKGEFISCTFYARIFESSNLRLLPSQQAPRLVVGIPPDDYMSCKSPKLHRNRSKTRIIPDTRHNALNCCKKCNTPKHSIGYTAWLERDTLNETRTAHFGMFPCTSFLEHC